MVGKIRDFEKQEEERDTGRQTDRQLLFIYICICSRGDPRLKKTSFKPNLGTFTEIIFVKKKYSQN